MNKLKKLFKSTRGESAIEFAIVIPVCLLVVFGIIEFGIVMWGNSSLNYATSYASRYAYVNPSASGTAISNYALSKISLAGNPITYTITKTATTVTINGTFTYSFLVVPLSPISITTQFIQSVPTSN